MSHDLSMMAAHAHHADHEREKRAAVMNQIEKQIEELESLKSKRGLTSNEHNRLKNLYENKERIKAEEGGSFLGGAVGFGAGMAVAGVSYGLGSALVAPLTLAGSFIGKLIAGDITKKRNSSKELEFWNLEYKIDGSQVQIKIGKITNNRRCKSGTLRINLWATDKGYNGGTIEGYIFATYKLDQLEEGYSYNDISQWVKYERPPKGNYFIAMTLQEYEDVDRWTIYDYWTFDNKANL